MGEFLTTSAAETETATAANDTEAAKESRKATGQKKENKVFFLLNVLFLLGMLLGALFIPKAGTAVLEALDSLFFSNIEARLQSASFATFVASTASSFVFLFAILFCGLSMWGAVIVPVLPVIRGFGLGMTAGYLYGLGTDGVFYYMAVILPGALVSLLAIQLSAVTAIRFSKRLNRARKLQMSAHHAAFAAQPSTRNYLTRLALAACLAIFAALLDMATAFVFSGLFQTFSL